MANNEQHPKTLRLKFGEYYSLKITDSGKNIINNVEVTPVSLETKQHLLSTPTFDKDDENDKGWIESLQEGLGFNNKNSTDDEKNAREDDFHSWTYEKNPYDDTKDERFKDQRWLLEEKSIFHAKDDQETGEKELDIPSHTVECEVQIMTQEKTYFLWWHTGYKNIEYKWSKEYATVEIVSRDVNHIKFKIIPNKKSLETFYRKNSASKECHVLNWRYRVTGGAVKVEKENKKVFQDYDDCWQSIIRGYYGSRRNEKSRLSQSGGRYAGGRN